jgi:cobalamin biosynthesis Mg chelatase CobN
MKIPHLDPQGNPIGEVEVPDPTKGTFASGVARKSSEAHDRSSQADAAASSASRPAHTSHPAHKRESAGEVLKLDGEPIANVRLHDQPGYASGGHLGMAIAVVAIVSIVAIAFFYLVFR